MKKLIDLLMQLGFSQYESKCYVALLGDFPAKPYQVGKAAGIPSAKIYEVISRLEQKGLIAEVSGDEKMYIPKDPDMAIREWREQYLHLLKEAQTALKAEMTAKPVNAVWNVKGRREVLRLGAELFSRATQSIFLAASTDLMEQWIPDVSKAQERRCIGAITRLWRAHGRTWVTCERIGELRISPQETARYGAGCGQAGSRYSSRRATAHCTEPGRKIRRLLRLPRNMSMINY